MALANVSNASSRISLALQKASEATGVEFDYLLKTAQRESSLQPGAKAKTSSAAGLFQFIENTWLKTIKQEGPRYGLGDMAAGIEQTRGGRYTVADRALRSEILALRHDPELSAVMAGAFTQQNAEILSDRLGRSPTQGELYIAHFLGADAGAKLVGLAGSEPRDRADAYFPRAAKANPSIFYNRNGPRSVAEVYRVLVAKHANETMTPQKPPEPVQAAERASEPTTPLAPVFEASPAGPAGLGAIGAWRTIVLSEEGAEAGAQPQPGGSFFEQMRSGRG
jgi:hypothetical protein